MTGEIDVDALLNDIAESHHEPLRGQVAQLARVVAEMTAYGDPGDPVLLEVRQLVEGLAACVESQLATERNIVFPMLRRLRQQTSISRCHAGMIRSRLTMVERDQARIRGIMLRLRDLGTEILSPGGGCEACHELLRVVEAASVNLHGAAQKQSGVLFPWAVAREASLAG